MNLNWYLNRLQTMSLPELFFRVQQQVSKRIKKARFTGYAPTPKLLNLPPKLLDTEGIDFSPEGSHFEILGLDWDYSQPINWHLDIRSQKSYPKIFCRDVNTRSDEFGIAKYAWEPNRHQFLPRLAMQYAHRKEEGYLELFMSLLQSWQEQNPYLIGVNWYSNIEVNIRLINWFLCWEILNANQLMEENAAFKAFVETCWVPLIYLHCKYSKDYPSKFSSANNHQISEGVGLFIASSYWSFKETPSWNRYSRKIVEKTLLKQHSKAGINKEETSEYIQFITDYYLIAEVVANRSQKPFSAAFKARFYELLKYIYEMINIRGEINHYGDGDDGRTFILEENPSQFNNYKSLLSSGVILYQDAHFKARDNGLDWKNRILFGAEGQRQYASVVAKESLRSSRFYKNEGHFLFRKESAGGKEIYLHFDAAPLGYLGIAAHGHADPLSFFMGVDGKWFLVDPGTFSYHTDMDWRNYFISSLAHNTITVDGQNPCTRGGPTMWMEHYTCEVLEVGEEGDTEWVRASHDGYKKQGVMHTRSIRFDRAAGQFDILDEVQVLDQNSHLLEMPFHLHPEVQYVENKKGIFQLKQENAREVELSLDEKTEIEIVKGKEKPILGWFSPSFYKKSPCPVILAKIQTSQSITLRSKICICESID